MSKQNLDVAQLTAGGDIGGLIRLLGYRKRFGSWRPARGADEVSLDIRLASIDGLVEVATDGSVDGVIEALAFAVGDDSDPRVRVQCVRALESLPGKSALPALVAAVDDADPNVRAAAAEALGTFGSTSWDSLYRALSDPDGRVRGAAAKSISHCLGSDRQDSVTALEKLGTAAAVSALAAIWDRRVARESVDQALLRVGAVNGAEYFAAIDSLAEEARQSPHGSESRLRRHLIVLLQEVDPDSVAPGLLERLGDQTDPHLSTLIWTLGELGSTEAASAIAGFVAGDETDFPVRREALKALEAIGTGMTPELLADTLLSGDVQLMHSAEAVLHGMGVVAVEPLLEVAGNRQADVKGRQIALRLLMDTGEARVVEPLTDLLRTDIGQGKFVGLVGGDLIDAQPPDPAGIGLWMAREDGVRVRAWLSREGRDVEDTRTVGIHEYVLARLHWLEPESAVEVALGLLDAGVHRSDPAIEALAIQLRTMANEADSESVGVEAGDQDMYPVWETESHEETRAEGRRLLARLEGIDPTATE